MIPYSRQTVDEEDIEAVVAALRSGWLTTGPAVAEFEEHLAGFVGTEHAVALSSGTAALHAIMSALGLGPGDEVIVPPMTFAATANCVLYVGATPVFADVERDTLLLDPREAERKISPRTRAIIAVDYGGHPCDYRRLRSIADRHGLALIADGCHALGAEYNGARVGSLADATAFSFHPVKHITTGEGGAVTTGLEKVAGHIRSFRNHGIGTDFRARQERKTWHYEIDFLGFNYRISDLQCALGTSQLTKLPRFLARRREIAEHYSRSFLEHRDCLVPLALRDGVRHAYHLYVIRLREEEFAGRRSSIFKELQERGVGVNVHYLPVYLHPLYRERLGAERGLCPRGEAAYEEILSLPIHPAMTAADTDFVVKMLLEVLERNRRGASRG